MELFSDFFVHPEEKPHKRIKAWILAQRSSFSLAVYLSVALHSIIFVIFSLSVLSSPSASTAILSNQRALFRAVEEDTGLTHSQEKGLTELLKGFDISGFNLSEDDKKQLYKKLIASYTLIKDSAMEEEASREITRDDLLRFMRQQGGIGLKSGKKVIPSISAEEKRQAKLNVLTKPVVKDLQSLQKFPAKDMDYYVSRGNVWVRSPSGTKIIPTQYFFKESPYEQILAQGVHLFTIVEGFPVLEAKPLPSIRYVDMMPESLFQEKAGRGFQVVLLSGFSDSIDWMLSEKQDDCENLEISPAFEEHFDKFCDEFLILSEEQQFLYFREKYLEKYDPNSEDLAYLTGRFFHRNLNNIIIPVSAISSAFDYLEELYFNKPLESQFVRFWQDYPDTLVGARVLLTLASHYDFERRAIAYLYDAYDGAKRYLRQKYKVAEVYDKETKCYVIQDIFEKLDRELRERGYGSAEEAMQKYVAEEIKIYDMVIAMGGESRNDGLYDLAGLYWDLGLRDLAVDTWAQIDDTYESEALDSIREALTWLDEPRKAYTLIDNILSWHATKGVGQRLKRLLDLGKWKARRHVIR